MREQIWRKSIPSFVFNFKIKKVKQLQKLNAKNEEGVRETHHSLLGADLVHQPLQSWVLCWPSWPQRNPG